MSSVVFSLKLDGERGATELQNPTECDWVHVEYASSETQATLHSLNLSEQVIDSLTREDTRPTVSVSRSGTLLLLRGINLNPASNPEDMVSLRLWIEPKRLISVRQRRLLSVQDVRAELAAGEGPSDVMGVVIAIIGKLANRISDYVNDVEERLEKLESRFLEEMDFKVRSQTGAIRREVAGVRRFLLPQREALSSLLSQIRTSLPEEQGYELREQTDRMTRYLEDLDLVRERSLVLQEEMANLSMEQQNQRMYALSIVAAIFLPITFVSGVFGMNVMGLPGIEEPEAFGYVALSMAAVTGIVLGFFKVNRWL